MEMSAECCLNVYGFEVKEALLATQTSISIGLLFFFLFTLMLLKKML